MEEWLKLWMSLDDVDWFLVMSCDVLVWVGLRKGSLVDAG